jgi:hypothetical protein
LLLFGSWCMSSFGILLFSSRSCSFNNFHPTTFVCTWERQIDVWHGFLIFFLVLGDPFQLPLSSPRVPLLAFRSCVPLAFFLSVPAPSLLQQLLLYNVSMCTGCGGCVLLDFFWGPARSSPFCLRLLLVSSFVYVQLCLRIGSFLLWFVFSALVSLLWMRCVYGFVFSVNPILCVEFASLVAAPFSEVDAFLADDLLLLRHRCVSVRPFLYTTVSCFVAPFSEVDAFFFWKLPLIRWVLASWFVCVFVSVFAWFSSLFFRG